MSSNLNVMLSLLFLLLLCSTSCVFCLWLGEGRGKRSHWPALPLCEEQMLLSSSRSWSMSALQNKGVGRALFVHLVLRAPWTCREKPGRFLIFIFPETHQRPWVEKGDASPDSYNPPLSPPSPGHLFWFRKLCDFNLACLIMCDLDVTWVGRISELVLSGLVFYLHRSIQGSKSSHLLSP